MFQYATQPQPIGKVLDHGFKLFTLTYTRVIAFSLAAAIISYLPNLFIPGLSSPDLNVLLQAMRNYWWLFLVTIIISMVFYNAMYYRIHYAVQDPDKDFANALATGIKKALPVFLASILFGLAIGLGLIALIVPGIILSLSLLFYQALIIIDNEGITSALKTSHRLVQGNWWRTATVFSIPLLVIIVVYVILGFVFGLSYTFMENQETALDFGAELLSVLISALLSPLFVAIALVQLNDLKLRSQGLDLKARLQK